MLTTTSDRPSHVVLSGAYVYWIEQGAGTLFRVPKSGGSAELIAFNQASPAELAVTSSYVLWVNRGDSPVTVKRADKTGGGVTTLASGVITSMTATDTDVYYNATPNLYSVPIAGGAPVLVHSQPPPGIGDILADGSDLFFTTVGTDTVLYQMPLAGGPPSAVSQCVGDTWTGDLNVAADADHIVWRAGNLFQVLDRNASCGNACYYASTYTRYTISGPDIYYGDNSGLKSAQITPVPFFSLKAKRPTPLSGVNEVVVAVDTDYVYWGESGKLVRLRR